MRREELDKIFGERVIRKLDSFVKDDIISKFNLKKMAGEMGVIQAYNAFKDRDPYKPLEAFHNMLDEDTWICWSGHSRLSRKKKKKFIIIEQAPTYQHFCSGTIMNYLSTLKGEGQPWKDC